MLYFVFLLTFLLKTFFGHDFSFARQNKIEFLQFYSDYFI